MPECADKTPSMYIFEQIIMSLYNNNCEQITIPNLKTLITDS